MKKKTNRSYVLPAKLKAEKDQIQFPGKKTHHKVSKFIFKLIKDGMQDNFNLQQFREIPVTYFRKVYGGNYKSEFIDVLEQKNIIQVNNSYSTGTDTTAAFCKSYRIHPEMLDVNDKFVRENFVNEAEDDGTQEDKYVYVKPSTQVTYRGTEYYCESVACMLHKIEKTFVRDLLGKLTFNTVSFWKTTNEVVESIDHNNFKTDDEITETYFYVVNNAHNWESYKTKQSALEYCKKHGLTLIQDKRNFYIDDLDQYIAKKKKNILLNYKWYATKLEDGIFYADRNRCNTRLDHNLTSICSPTMKQIIADNDLVEIDLKNSQFTILANWMKNEGMCEKYEDVNLFYRYATSGILYKSVACMLHKTEKEAKQLMMSMCFSHHKNNTANKTLFKQQFPNVVEFIDNFKKQNELGSRGFAIELQKREAAIFVDDLFYNINQLGFFCLTKHDSLIVKRQDLEETIKIITAYFDHTGFECSIETEGEVKKLHLQTV